MSDIEDILRRVIEAQAELLMRVAEVERRTDNTVRHGKVTDVDTKKQMARIEIGERDGEPLKSAWVPYGQLAGAYKSHRPPTKGQQMTMFAPNGEVRQAMLMPFTWSDDNKSPSEKEDEHVTTFGKLKIVEKGEAYELSVDDASLKLSRGKLTAAVGAVEFELTPDGYTLSGPTGVLAVGQMLYTGVTSKSDKTGALVETVSGPAMKHKSKA